MRKEGGFLLLVAPRPQMLPKLYFSIFVAAVSMLAHSREESPTRYGKNIEYFTGNIGEMIINNIIKLFHVDMKTGHAGKSMRASCIYKMTLN